MAATLEKNSKIAISETDLTEAREECSEFLGRHNRNRAVSNLVGIKTAVKYLKENGLNPDTRYSAHTIKRVLADFDIADLYIDDKRIDVRTVFSKDLLFIPKIHYEYGILPSFYMFVKINKTLQTGEVLGFLDPSSIDNEKASEEFYFPEKENLISLKLFKQKLKKLTPKSYPIKNTAETRADIIRYTDNALENKPEFIKNLVNNLDMRKAMIEFENAETLFSEISEKVKEFTSYNKPTYSTSEGPRYYTNPEGFYADEVGNLSNVLDLSNEQEILLDFSEVSTEEDSGNEEITLSYNENDSFIADNELYSEEIESLQIEPALQTEDDKITEDELETLETFEEAPFLNEDKNSESDLTLDEPETEFNLVETKDDFLISEEITDGNELIEKVDDLIETNDLEIDNPEEIQNILTEEISTEDKPFELENTEDKNNDFEETSTEENNSFELLDNGLNEDDSKENINTAENQNVTVEDDLDKLFNSGVSQDTEDFEIPEEYENTTKPITEDIQNELPIEEEEEILNDPINTQEENQNVAPESIEDIFEEVDLYQNQPKNVGFLKDKKLIIAGSIAGLVLVGGIIGSTIMSNMEMKRFDEDPTSKVHVKNIKIEEVEASNQAMPNEEIVENIIPEGNNELSNLPPVPAEIMPVTTYEIKNIEVSWEVPEEYIENPSRKNGLLIIGRKIKLALSNDLLLTDELPTSKNMIINLNVEQNELKATSLKVSSGSKTIDKLVLQGVNDILRHSKLSTSELNKETGYPALIINF